MGEEPEEEREGGAKYKAGHDGEVERSVFAAMDDVARKAAKAEGQSATKVEKSAGKDKKASKQEESASEFTNGGRCLLSSKYHYIDYYLLNSLFYLNTV